MKILLFLSCFFLFGTSAFSATPSLATIEKALKTSGQTGWVHGASPELGLYVFTVRDPNDFFSHQEFPLVTTTQNLEREIARLNRHDEIRIKGSFLNNGAPIQHIQVDQVEIIKSQEPLSPAEHQYEAHFPQDLLGKTEVVGKVHAIAEGGKVLVMEIKDGVVPVIVKRPELTRQLFRNDFLKVKVKLKKHPQEPSHLVLDLNHPSPITVLGSIQSWHGKHGTIEGPLVLFPKSPQVVFNVFAIQVTESNGLKREFTLVNFENTEVFKKIREKLQSAWDKDPSNTINGRNKLIQPDLRLKATGVFNVVDPGQANPQILLKDEKAITVP